MNPQAGTAAAKSHNSTPHSKNAAVQYENLIPHSGNVIPQPKIVTPQFCGMRTPRCGIEFPIFGKEFALCGNSFHFCGITFGFFGMAFPRNGRKIMVCGETLAVCENIVSVFGMGFPECGIVFIFKQGILLNYRLLFYYTPKPFGKAGTLYNHAALNRQLFLSYFQSLPHPLSRRTINTHIEHRPGSTLGKELSDYKDLVRFKDEEIELIKSEYSLETEWRTDLENIITRNQFITGLSVSISAGI